MLQTIGHIKKFVDKNFLVYLCNIFSINVFIDLINMLAFCLISQIELVIWFD